MMKTCVMGASGYTGAELIKILVTHPTFDLSACFVSHNSADAHKGVGEVHPQLAHIQANDAHKNALLMQPLADEQVEQIGHEHDIIFMALPHEVSHHWAHLLRNTSAKIFDLSGAFRLSDTNTFERFYGFKHAYPELMQQRVYGLAEWHYQQIQNAKQLIAVPGCYPTASLLGLKPLMHSALLDLEKMPIINAVSGVSGAGRKASMTSSFYEVSLQAYGVLGHRHTPEIEEFANSDVIFTPHLGAFKRGILATITAFTSEHVTEQDIDQAFVDAYANKPLVRLCSQWPKVDQVAHTPFCDIHWAFDKDKRCVVVTSAIDNLLKGAASQAVQCANIMCKLDETTGLIHA
ncbi:N-acetyl-gamma-glutamyl-phosphate reductase [Glaciecola siphonariae]|uniref:N-acetyl-gamma-glutamyl-phosphate reductase n=1 Tax=Glaciecola siphonariae TaxID=521012 RepID=A0ABV9LWM4_9ALTE